MLLTDDDIENCNHYRDEVMPVDPNIEQPDEPPRIHKVLTTGKCMECKAKRYSREKWDDVPSKEREHRIEDEADRERVKNEAKKAAKKEKEAQERTEALEKKADKTRKRFSKIEVKLETERGGGPPEGSGPPPDAPINPF